MARLNISMFRSCLKFWICICSYELRTTNIIMFMFILRGNKNFYQITCAFKLKWTCLTLTTKWLMRNGMTVFHQCFVFCFSKVAHLRKFKFSFNEKCFPKINNLFYFVYHDIDESFIYCVFCNDLMYPYNKQYGPSSTVNKYLHQNWFWLR